MMLLFVLALGCYMACAQPLAAADPAHACCDPKSKSSDPADASSCERPDGIVQDIVAVAPPVPAFTLLPAAYLEQLLTAPTQVLTAASSSPPIPLRI